MTYLLADFLAAVGNLQRARYTWNFARKGSAAMVLLIGAAFDIEPPYRSPHSSAGNYTQCDTDDPDADCISGGWCVDGRCHREEADRGECPHRRQGAPALTAQVSRNTEVEFVARPSADIGGMLLEAARKVPRSPSPSEMAVKEWVVRNTCNAAREGSESVRRAALAYLSQSTCTLDDILALGVWMTERANTEKPWKEAA